MLLVLAGEGRFSGPRVSFFRGDGERDLQLRRGECLMVVVVVGVPDLPKRDTGSRGGFVCPSTADGEEGEENKREEHDVSYCCGLGNIDDGEQ